MDDQTAPDFEGIHNTLVDTLTSPDFFKQHPDLPSGDEASLLHFQGDKSIRATANDVGNAYESAMTKAGAPAEVIAKGRKHAETLAQQRARQYSLQAATEYAKTQPTDEWFNYIPLGGHVLKAGGVERDNVSIDRLQNNQASGLDYLNSGFLLKREQDEQNRSWAGNRVRDLAGIAQFAGDVALTGGLGGGLARAGAAKLAARAGLEGGTAFGALGASTALRGLAGATLETGAAGLGMTAAMPQRILGNYAEQSEKRLALRPDGSLDVSAPDSEGSRLWKATASSYIDNTLMPGLAGAFTKGTGPYAQRVLKKALAAVAAGEISQDAKHAIAGTPEGSGSFDLAAGIATGDAARLWKGLGKIGNEAVTMGLLEAVVQAGHKPGVQPNENADAKKLAEQMANMEPFRNHMKEELTDVLRTATPAADADAAHAGNDQAAPPAGGESGQELAGENAQSEPAQVAGDQSAASAENRLPLWPADAGHPIEGDTDYPNEPATAGAEPGAAGRPEPASPETLPGAAGSDVRPVKYSNGVARRGIMDLADVGNEEDLSPQEQQRLSERIKEATKTPMQPLDDDEERYLRRWQAGEILPKKITDNLEAKGYAQQPGKYNPGAHATYESGQSYEAGRPTPGGIVYAKGVASGIPPNPKPNNPKPQPPQPPAPQPATPPPQRGFIDAIKSALKPSSRDDLAQESAGRFRENNAIEARRRDVATEAVSKGEALLDKQLKEATTPQDKQDVLLNVTDAFENPDKAAAKAAIARLHPDLQESLTAARELYDEYEPEMRGLGIVKTFISNYMSHLWKKPGASPDDIGQMLGKRSLAGKEGFRKQRRDDIPTYRDGIALGLEPVDYNPMRLIRMNLGEMAKSIKGRTQFAQDKDAGLIKYVRSGAKAPENYRPIPDKLATAWAGSIPVSEFYDENMRKGLMDFAQSLGIDVQTTMRGEAGSTSPGGAVERHFGTPESVLTHEIGHKLEDKYKIGAQLERDPQMKQEIHDLAAQRYAGTSVGQEYKNYVDSAQERRTANLLTALLHAPELMEDVAPKTKAALEQWIASKKELRPLEDIKPSLVLSKATTDLRTPGLMKMGQYYAPDTVAKLYENYLSPGLQGNKIYDVVRGAGNALNMFQLGLSAYHGVASAIHAVIGKAGLGLKETFEGVKGLDADRLGSGLTKLATSPAAPFLYALEGRRMGQEWDRPGAQPDAAGDVRNLEIGGGRNRMDQGDFGGNHWQRMKEALAKIPESQWNRAPALYHAAMALPEFFSKPLMQWWVPNLKKGMFAEMARSDLEKLGPNATHEQTQQTLQKAWQSVENRLGQMTYDNQFWDRRMKDILMLGVRSVGWNGGTIGEIGGGLKDLTTGRGLTHRAAFTLALPMITAAIGASIQYALTGKGPDELKDYIFPKTGNKRKDGSPDRLALPTYMKDVASLFNRADELDTPLANAWKMAKHKTNPIVSVADQLFENKDFYGNYIQNKGAPGTQRALELAKYLGKTILPFSAQGTMQEYKTTGSVKKAALSVVGLTPANADMTRSWDQQRAIEAKYSKGVRKKN